MPELPEVETIRRDLEQYILNLRIKKVTAISSKVLRTSLKNLQKKLLNTHITAITRRGKLLIFSLHDEKHHLLIHLKMTGQLIYRTKKFLIAGGHSLGQRIGGLPDAYTRLILTFQNGAELFLNDMRLFAYAHIVDHPTLEKTLSAFGPEPLSSDFTKNYLEIILKKRQTSIKAILLNQTLIAGIGNIYADEVCFAAGIRPDRKASTIKKDGVARLHEAIITILPLAITKRGTTFNSYVDGTGKKGNFVSHLQVYCHGGKPCPRCGTTLQKKKVAGRGTVICPQCQK